METILFSKTVDRQTYTFLTQENIISLHFVCIWIRFG